MACMACTLLAYVWLEHQTMALAIGFASRCLHNKARLIYVALWGLRAVQYLYLNVFHMRLVQCPLPLLVLQPPLKHQPSTHHPHPHVSRLVRSGVFFVSVKQCVARY